MFLAFKFRFPVRTLSRTAVLVDEGFSRLSSCINDPLFWILSTLPFEVYLFLV